MKTNRAHIVGPVMLLTQISLHKPDMGSWHKHIASALHELWNVTHKTVTGQATMSETPTIIGMTHGKNDFKLKFHTSTSGFTVGNSTAYHTRPPQTPNGGGPTTAYP